CSMHAAAQLARYIVGRHTVRAIVCSLLIPLVCAVHARSQSPATASPPATVSSNASSNAAESIPAYPATTTPTYPHPAAAPSPWVPFETTVPPAYNYPRMATELTRHGDYM